jgi:hypothetical protein
MQIEVKIGGKTMVLRGNPEGTVDLCWWQETKDEAGNVRRFLQSYRYFSSLPSALERVAEMRVCLSDAKTLKELMEAIQEQREWLRSELCLK